VLDTGGLKYTCYRVFQLLNKKLLYFFKKIISILYTGRAKKEIFFADSIKCNIDEM